MKKQKIKNICLLLGISLVLLGISLGLPRAVFSLQNALQEKKTIIREDTAVNIALEKNPAGVSMSYAAKVGLAAEEEVVATKLYNHMSMTESISLDSDKVLADALKIMEKTWEIEEILTEGNILAFQTMDSYSVLLMDRSDFSRQYKAWEVFVRIGNHMFGGWIDDETGRYTALWYEDGFERVPEEMLLEYYGEPLE